MLAGAISGGAALSAAGLLGILRPSLPFRWAQVVAFAFGWRRRSLSRFIFLGIF